MDGCAIRIRVHVVTRLPMKQVHLHLAYECGESRKEIFQCPRTLKQQAVGMSPPVKLLLKPLLQVHIAYPRQFPIRSFQERAS